jgi:1-phosphofructokinase
LAVRASAARSVKGSDVEVVNVDSRPLGRHAADELYGIALGAGLDCELTMVTGCWPSDGIDADIYRRLVADLRANGKRVIADLTGPPLRASLGAGVDLIRLSDEELVLEDYAADAELEEVVAGVRKLQAAGARHSRPPASDSPAASTWSTPCDLAWPRAR